MVTQQSAEQDKLDSGNKPVISGVEKRTVPTSNICQKWNFHTANTKNTARISSQDR